MTEQDRGFCIVDMQAGLPQYYSIPGAGKFGVGGGIWVSDSKEAVLFVRRDDADNFRKMYMPYHATANVIAITVNKENTHEAQPQNNGAGYQRQIPIDSSGRQ